MAITNRNLSIGTKLTANYKKQAYTCEVVEGDEAINYRLEDGRQFKSPSAAGAAIMGEGRTCNGWAFWSVVGGETGEPAGAETTASDKPKRTRKPKGEAGESTERVVQHPDNNGHALPIVEQADERYECGECGTGFESIETVTAHLAEVHAIA